MTPIFIYSIPYLGMVPHTIWGLLVVTGFFQAFYYINLGNAYRLNDMSLAYPIARSLPVIIVPIVCAIAGFGKPLSLHAVLGMIIIAAGCMLLPLSSFKWATFRGFFHYSFLFVIFAAIGISGYSIIDSLGLELLTGGVHPFSRMGAALFFIAFENLCILLYIWPFVLLTRREKINLRIIKKRSLLVPLLAGPVVTFTYTLVLLAMQFATNVSYIVAFRQVSIVIGVILGIVILKEKSTPFKIVGTLMIFAGLVLAAVG